MCKVIKWVDEVVVGVFYVIIVEIFDKYKCDFCVYGDDIILMVDGYDMYVVVKVVGWYKECKCMVGVFMINLVGWMFLMIKEYFDRVFLFIGNLDLG